MKCSYISYISILQSRKHCEAIMDDLLLFTPSKKVVILDMMNGSSEILILNPKEALEILDLRLLGY